MATPTKCLLFAIFFCLLDASDEFEPHDAHKNVTLNLITKEAKRWYQDFNRTLTRAECVSKPSEHQQQRLYDLWYTGLVCNLWTKFPYDEMEEDFMMTYILIADNPKIFLRMKAEPPNFMNPFRRLYHRSSASLRETLHPLAVAANWDISQYKTLRDQDAFLNVQNKLIEMRSELNQQQTSKLCQIPFVFTSCRRFFDNASLCLDQVTWLKVEVYLTTLGLMLDVEQAAGQHIVNLKSDCIHCIAKMVSIASVNLKQTHKLIHMVTKKAPELTEFFWIQRAHLLQLSSHGRCSNKFEQDPADKLLVKLKRKSVDTFTYTQVMELLESCIYFLKYTALSAFRESSNGKNGNAQTHYFAIQVLLYFCLF